MPIYFFSDFVPIGDIADFRALSIRNIGQNFFCSLLSLCLSIWKMPSFVNVFLNINMRIPFGECSAMVTLFQSQKIRIESRFIL
jgi:hypothetical protein